MKKIQRRISKRIIKDNFESGKVKRRLLFSSTTYKGVHVPISSVSKFKSAVELLKKGGIGSREKKVIEAAKAKAAAQLLRRDLSKTERRQFREILKVKTPRVTKRPPKRRTKRSILGVSW